MVDFSAESSAVDDMVCANCPNDCPCGPNEECVDGVCVLVACPLIEDPLICALISHVLPSSADIVACNAPLAN